MPYMYLLIIPNKEKNKYKITNLLLKVSRFLNHSVNKFI